MKIAVVFLALVAIAAAMVPVFAQEKADKQISTVSGEVVSADLEKSVLIVKQVTDATANTYENKTILVSPETKILKGEVVLKLTDLKSGEKVTVGCVSDSLGKLTAENIAIEAAEVTPVAK